MSRTPAQLTAQILRLRTSRVKAIWSFDKAAIDKKIRRLEVERACLLEVVDEDGHYRPDPVNDYSY